MLIRHLNSTVPAITAKIINVDKALISGDTPIFTDAYIFMGSVTQFGPARKSVITTSSREMENANTAPDTTPGIMTGNVTLKNVWMGFAPKSIDASSIEQSKSNNLVRTVIYIYGNVKTTCPPITAYMPFGKCSSDTRHMSATPNTTPGTISGIYMLVFSIFLPLNL